MQVRYLAALRPDCSYFTTIQIFGYTDKDVQVSEVGFWNSSFAPGSKYYKPICLDDRATKKVVKYGMFKIDSTPWDTQTTPLHPDIDIYGASIFKDGALRLDLAGDSGKYLQVVNFNGYVRETTGYFVDWCDDAQWLEWRVVGTLMGVPYIQVCNDDPPHHPYSHPSEQIHPWSFRIQVENISDIDLVITNCFATYWKPPVEPDTIYEWACDYTEVDAKRSASVIFDSTVRRPARGYNENPVFKRFLGLWLTTREKSPW